MQRESSKVSTVHHATLFTKVILKKCPFDPETHKEEEQQVLLGYDDLNPVRCARVSLPSRPPGPWRWEVLEVGLPRCRAQKSRGHRRPAGAVGAPQTNASAWAEV